MGINRRDFLKTASATGIGLMAGVGVTKPKHCCAKTVLGKQAYQDRMGFGAWINDVRSEPCRLIPGHL